MTAKKETVKPHALLIGEGNSVALTGCNMRWVKDTAQRLGVPIIRASAHKHFVRADLFLDAMWRIGAETPANQGDSPTIVDCADPAAAVRAMLRKRRAAR